METTSPTPTAFFCRLTELLRPPESSLHHHLGRPTPNWGHRPLVWCGPPDEAPDPGVVPSPVPGPATVVPKRNMTDNEGHPLPVLVYRPRGLDR